MMLRPRRALALAACLAIALAGTACGSDDEPTAATTAAAAPATAAGSPSGDGACTEGELPVADPGTDTFAAPDQVVKPGCAYTAVLATSLGDITVELDPAAAPQTVNSFVFLATNAFFDGLTFHRVVPGFVIQGGDPTGTGTGGPGYTIPDELPPSPGYPLGALAMANAGPGTSGSQFFIVTGDASALPNAYSLFGTVTEGLDVAQAIEGLADPGADPGDPTAQGPSETVTITSVRVTETTA